MRLPSFLGSLAVLAVLACGGACADAPQEPVTFDAYGSVDLATPPSGWSLALTRVRLAFGPAYFCAARSGSSTLCASAVVELRDAATLDGLVPSPQRLGRAAGFSGAVRSAGFDLGLDWFDTMPAPAPSPAAPDGRSLVAEGTARREGRPDVPFVVRLDVVPQYQGQLAVPTAEAAASITAATSRLDVRFAVGAWLSAIDFDAAADSGASPLVVEPGTPDHDRVLLALRNARPPTFTFTEFP